MQIGKAITHSSMHVLRTMFVMFVLILVAPTCQKSSPKAVIYPQGWPLAWLTVPESSTAAKTYYATSLGDSTDGSTMTNMNMEGLMWFGVGFYCNKGVKEIENDLEAKCTNEGFIRSSSPPRGVAYFDKGNLHIGLFVDDRQRDVYFLMIEEASQ